MSNIHLFSSFLGISDKSYYRWKRKDHIELIALLEKYFTVSDIREFSETGKIKRFENLPDLDNVYSQLETKVEKKARELDYDLDKLTDIIAIFSAKVKNDNIKPSFHQFYRWLDLYSPDEDSIEPVIGIFSVLDNEEFGFFITYKS